MFKVQERLGTKQLVWCPSAWMCIRESSIVEMRNRFCGQVTGRLARGSLWGVPHAYGKGRATDIIPGRAQSRISGCHSGPLACIVEDADALNDWGADSCKRSRHKESISRSHTRLPRDRSRDARQGLGPPECAAGEGRPRGRVWRGLFAPAASPLRRRPRHPGHHPTAHVCRQVRRARRARKPGVRGG